MKKTLFTFTALALSLSATIPPSPALAALPFSIGSETLPSLAPMLEKVTPAVVSIAVEGKQTSIQKIPDSFRFFFGPNVPESQTQNRPFKGQGSGVIVDAQQGYIVTNYHVINGSEKILVKLHDGQEINAQLIGGDQLSDIALIKLDYAKDLTQIKMSNSDKLRVGDFAVAIGNPFGLGQTVTSGIVSALARSGLNLEGFENFIQTDAAINSGNSGGALVNLDGELIGINTAILGANGGNIGIGFAIPSNMVKNLTEQLIEFGEVKRGVLGVQGGEITAELAKALGYESSKGAFVSQVIADSAADKAGIKAGDIITSLNGTMVSSFSELRAKIATYGAGKNVQLGVVRDGKSKTYTVKLDELNKDSVDVGRLHPSLSGVELSNTSNNDKIKGVKVVSVETNSLAEKYQLKKDDIIIGINRQSVTNIEQLRKILAEQKGILALNIQRGDRQIYIVIN